MRLAVFSLMLPCCAALPLQAAAPCEQAGSNQAQLTACASQAYQQADARLNTLYGEARSRLAHDEGALRALATAQRAWLAFRDAECAFVRTRSEGGSAQAMVTQQCLATQTRARAQSLRRYLNCEEGDLACPLPPLK